MQLLHKYVLTSQIRVNALCSTQGIETQTQAESHLTADREMTEMSIKEWTDPHVKQYDSPTPPNNLSPTAAY